MEIKKADINNAEEILELQKLSYLSEAEIYNDYLIPPLHQTIEEIKKEFQYKTFIKVISNGKIIGSIRGYEDNNTCYIDKIIVHPVYQNQGIGTRLLNHLEQLFEGVKRYELFTGYKSEKNLHIYKKNGYKRFKEEKLNKNVKLIYLEKIQ
ncbi:MAG: GNAT family N-acetyltransferase [Candidatus Lokiarchaeota archaeon]|nr:GNAT family N-acetyltransferase [Candidatus Lokiarchaeota archaeon]